jgi:tetratricopeptide (TPR) repeat protein
VLGRSGRDLEALEHLDAAVELSPGSAIAWGLRGELRVVTASGAAALDLRTAVRLEPRSTRWRTGLGRALADSHAARAEASLRAALAIDAAYVPAHAYLAALLQRQERDADAAVHYASALSNIDALERALGAVGVARLNGQYAVLLQRMGRDRESVSAYESALAHGERSPLLLNNLAWLLATGDESWRNPGRAVRLAEEAVDAKRDDPGTLDTLATALAAAGRDAEARATAARALARAEAAGDSRLAASIRQRFPAAAP